MLKSTFLICFIFQALVLSQFMIEPKDVSFATFLSCSDAIIEFVVDRRNWGSPFLPQAPGCPELLHEGNALVLEREIWRCP